MRVCRGDDGLGRRLELCDKGAGGCWTLSLALDVRLLAGMDVAGASGLWHPFRSGGWTWAMARTRTNCFHVAVVRMLVGLFAGGGAKRLRWWGWR